MTQILLKTLNLQSIFVKVYRCRVTPISYIKCSKSLFPCFAKKPCRIIAQIKFIADLLPGLSGECMQHGRSHIHLIPAVSLLLLHFAMRATLAIPIFKRISRLRTTQSSLLQANCQCKERKENGLFSKFSR